MCCCLLRCFYWDWCLDWEVTLCATLEFGPLGVAKGVCPSATRNGDPGELPRQIGVNSQKQILRGFMANRIEIAETNPPGFYGKSNSIGRLLNWDKGAAERKRFLNVFTKNVWNAGNREMWTEATQTEHWTNEQRGFCIWRKNLIPFLTTSFQLAHNEVLFLWIKPWIFLTLPNPALFIIINRPAFYNDSFCIFWTLFHNLFLLQSFVRKRQYPGSICWDNPDHSGLKPIHIGQCGDIGHACIWIFSAHIVIVGMKSWWNIVDII